MTKHNNVNFIAHITPKAAYYHDCIEAIKHILPATRAEKGCLRFELYENADRSQLTLIERFANQAAFDFHHQQDYTQNVFELYKGWLAKEVEIVPLLRGANPSNFSYG
ncbi:antibiotic biosynthesis monooxygenase [Pseudoalteromonas sp. JBTF-M23]|uniref:Antibiotic biosynthesis monooxygenase n=1 Tax=Pseudoalteromonas caenipelagi TaxID=2726988 RepID=A0A849VEQ7_9GAMM|nr:putative quinol monooxygenase [Pseudoalteromonas caenipelagi]NOU51258.1 antibiotic biosynthesis monooxygenase [Pseudoalteromonas caenipelagi]